MKNNSLLTKLITFIGSHTLEYNHSNKEQFKEMGLKAMRRLASALKLRELEASFNPGGIAVSGDLHLHGMFNDKIGIYITISQWGNKVNFLYRTVTGMKDYTGGQNNYFYIVHSEKEVVKEIHRLCGVRPEELTTKKRLSQRDLVKPGKSIEQLTGNKRKDYQERYDKAYEAIQKHFQYGNYFRVNENSHERIHDLTLAMLAFENVVVNKGAVSEHKFLSTKFKFPSGNEGQIYNLINCYRSEMWELFAELTGHFVEEF
jgi:hypothetical protein